jgi:hypothetical protein
MAAEPTQYFKKSLLFKSTVYTPKNDDFGLARKRRLLARRITENHFTDTLRFYLRIGTTNILDKTALLRKLRKVPRLATSSATNSLFPRIKTCTVAADWTSEYAGINLVPGILNVLRIDSGPEKLLKGAEADIQIRSRFAASRNQKLHCRGWLLQRERRQLAELFEGLCGVECADKIPFGLLLLSKLKNKRSAGSAEIRLVSGQLPMQLQQPSQTRDVSIRADNGYDL